VGEDETVWTEREFDGHDFRDDDLSRLRTERVVFTECDFSGVDMSESEHVGSAFRNCTFRRTSLLHSTFRHCSFLGSVFTECRMRPIKFVEVDFTLTVLGASDLRGVDLSDCRLREASLVEADLRKAVLRRADLSGARLQNAKLDEADLRGAQVDPTLWTSAALRKSTSSRPWASPPRTVSTFTVSDDAETAVRSSSRPKTRSPRSFGAQSWAQMPADHRCDPLDEFVHWRRRDGFHPQDVPQISDAQQLRHRQIDPKLGIRLRNARRDVRVHLPLNELAHQVRRLVMGGRPAENRHQLRARIRLLPRLEEHSREPFADLASIATGDSGSDLGRLERPSHRRAKEFSLATEVVPDQRGINSGRRGDVAYRGFVVSGTGEHASRGRQDHVAGVGLTARSSDPGHSARNSTVVDFRKARG
jgi:Pentapeptide repeats (9 copies)/Pentapeptide repeats (8 copies)